MWLQRLQTLVKGEVWKGGQENDVKVQESLLRQLVQQGFEREAAKAALKKTNNDDFAALLILTSPQEAEPDNKTDFASDDSNEAKQQRLLDYFRDLGDQYWGWQNESAKRGRGFKGALKSNFIPLLDDIRKLAADELPFCDSLAVPYQALCFLNRGLDECPPIAEDRDRDRYRMSKETGPILPKLLARVANLEQESYKNSLVCELVKETFAILEKLCTQAISSKLDTNTRLQGVNCILGFVREFEGLVSISQGNAGLPGASGKLTPVALHPAIRSLPLFVSSIKSSDLNCYLEIARALQDLGHLLSRNDPTLVEGVLTVYSAFLRSLDKLSQSNRSLVFESFVPEGGSVLAALLNLLATCKHSKIFGLAVKLVSTMCLLSQQLLTRLVDSSKSSSSAVPTKILECIESALNGDGKQIRMTGILSLVDDLLGCITEGHAKIYKEASRFREIDLSKGIIDTSDDNMDDSELKEGFDFDDDEIPHRSLAELQERRAEFEIRMHRLQRTKLARHDGSRIRRRHFMIDPDAFGEGSSGVGSRAAEVSVRELLSGTRVRRGQDWKWGDQDGGQGCEGVVISGTEKGAEGWIRVQWDAGGRNGYRWGAEESYDVQPVHSNALAYALQRKDAEGLTQAIRCTNAETQDNEKLSASSFLHYLSSVEEGISDDRDVQILKAMMTELNLDLNSLIDGKLPLNAATERGRKDIVDWMLSQGADSSLKDSDGVNAIETLYQSIQSVQHDSFSDLYSLQCKLIKLFESEPTTPAKREFIFKKNGGQRNFGRNNPGFRFPLPSNFDSGSFSVRIRFKPAETCCHSSAKVCLLTFGAKNKARDAKRSAQGFGIFLSHGYLRCGPGLCSEQAANANISIYTGRWCEMTCVYCATTKSIRLYIDGYFRSSIQLQTTESVRINPEGDIFVGVCPENLEGERCSGFFGSISHISIHNSVMSDSEVQDSFSQRKTACTDSHPELQVPFSESICHILLGALKKPIEGKSGKGQAATKRHMMYILSKVLPYCSKGALVNDMENLISLIDISTYEIELPSQKSDFRIRLNGKNQSNYISALICMDTIMRNAAEVFKEPITRCGAVARVRQVAQQTKSVGGSTIQAAVISSSDLIQNASKFIISQYFDADNMEYASKGCQEVMANLNDIASLLRDYISGSKGSTAPTMPRHEIERELRWKLKDLLHKNDGVYVEELMNSEVPLLLAEYLEVLSTNTAALVDPIFEIDEPGDLFDDSELLSNLVQLLRQACDKLPMESSHLLPLVVPDSDLFHLGYRCLRQKVILRFEKANPDDDLPDLSNAEVRAEPLCLNSDVRSKLISLMKTSKNKSNDDGTSHRDVRFVMQNFAHESETTPHFLIQRMRSLAECESRALNLCPALQRSFEALPELNTWHKETPNRGSAKKTLRISLNKNDVDQIPVEEQSSVDFFGRHRADMEDEEYDDEEMFETGEVHPFMAACSSQPRYQPSSHTPASSDFEPPPLKLQIVPGKEGRYGYRPFIDFLQLESDSIGQMTSDDSSEDKVPAMERSLERKVPGGAKERDAKAKKEAESTQDQAGVAVDLEDEQTLFEAITRLSALKEEASPQDKHKPSVGRRQDRETRPQFVHPNKFWEKTFTVRYSRDEQGKKEQGAKAKTPQASDFECEGGQVEDSEQAGAHDSHSSSSSASHKTMKQKRKFEFLKDSKLLHCIRLYDLLTDRYHKRLLMLGEHLSSQSIGLHIRKQLDDPLTVGSGILTKIPWLFGLCNLHALVPFSVRERFFYASALGVCRALLSLDVDHEGLNLETTGIELMRTNPFKDSPRLLIASRSIISEKVPELQRETIEIDHRREGHDNKPRLIDWAKEILRAHASKETVLDVTWRGEAGHGSGPTRKFYEKVAAIIEGQDGEEEFTQLWRDVSAANKEGLFPEHLPGDNEKRSSILNTFEFIGLFIGKAIQQKQMPGLCLAKPFYKLLIGLPVDVSDLKGVDDIRFQSLEKIMFWAQEANAILSKPEQERDKGDLKTLEDIGERVQYLEFADGSSVSVGNLQSYAEEVLRNDLAMLEVDEQVEAVRRGISQVFPWRMLAVFSPEEMQQKLWSDLEWDECKLEKIVRPGPMWPEDKEQINWLRKEMLAMDMPQRRAFVKFVTASVCMPPEENPIIVHPQVTSRKDMDDCDRKLPTCRTCANYLYLPPYSSHLILQERLGKAIWEEHIAFD